MCIRDRIHILLGGDVARGGVQAGVVCPLVEHALRLLLHVPGEGIFRNDGRAEARNQLVDAVVNFRIDMIWAADQHDDAAAFFARLLDHLFALFANVRHCLLYTSRCV